MMTATEAIASSDASEGMSIFASIRRTPNVQIVVITNASAGSGRRSLTDVVTHSGGNVTSTKATSTTQNSMSAIKAKGLNKANAARGTVPMRNKRRNTVQ